MSDWNIPLDFHECSMHSIVFCKKEMKIINSLVLNSLN